MNDYTSSYAQRYLLYEDAGAHYNSVIANQFEKTIWILEQEVLQDIISYYFPTTRTKKLLDYACGTGRVIQFLADSFAWHQAVGADISLTMLEEAKRHTPSTTSIKYVVMNAGDEIKNMEQRFDVLTAFRLFLNLEPENRLKILNGLKKYLTDDGILIFNNHMNRYSLKGLSAYLLHTLFHRPLKSEALRNEKSVINTLSERECRELIEKAGLRVEKVHYIAVLPGHKEWLPFPQTLYLNIERILMKIPLFHNFAKDQIYVCRVLD